MKRLLILIFLLVSMVGLAQDAPSIGDPVKAGHFEVIVHEVGAGTIVNTGNPYTDVEAEPGAGFLTLVVSFHNTDKRERMVVSSGTLSFLRDDEEYQISQTEIIPVEGFGIFLETVNPTMTFKTKLVYKIPIDTTGPVWWLPPNGRTWIHVANINP